MERNSKGIAVTVAILAAIVISLMALLAILNRRDETVGLKQEIQYDDFAFSVEAVHKATSLGFGESHANAQGVYYIVTLKIANHAKRVDYTFKRSAAVLLDDLGREFRLSESGQRALESTKSNNCSEPIRAGASCTTEVAFEVPENARVSLLKISEGGSVGDILDFVFYGTKRIALGSLQ